MNSFRILILFVFLPTIVWGQKYKTDFVISRSDSILKSELGDSLFLFSRYDPNTCYEYKTLFGKTKWETLNKYENTKGKFVKADMRWYMVMPYPQCPSFDTIKGMTYFFIDSLLRPTVKPYLDFVPDFYWNKQNCNIISKEEAILIANEQNLKKSTEPLNARIVYNSNTKTFTWEISNYISREKDFYNNDYGEVEIVIIDAITGVIKHHVETHYGPLY